MRHQLGITQQQLADALALTRNYVAKIESGMQTPSLRVLRSLESLRVDKTHKLSTSGSMVANESFDVTGALNPPPSVYVDPRKEKSPLASDVQEEAGQMLRPEHQPRHEPTETTIREHIEKYLAAARAAPGGIGHAWIQVRKHLRVDDFEIEPPEHET